MELNQTPRMPSTGRHTPDETGDSSAGRWTTMMELKMATSTERGACPELRRVREGRRGRQGTWRSGALKWEDPQKVGSLTSPERDFSSSPDTFP